MKKIISIIVTLLFVYHLNAQSSQSKQIDFLYEQFRTSYQNADSNLLDKLYWPDAVYMWSNTAIENGRSNFMKNFGSFFRRLNDLKDSIDIIFQVEKRVFSVDKTMCTDVGYFVFTRKGSKEQCATGKMVNVFTQRNSEWRFLVDMSGEAPKEVFKGTATITHTQ